MPSDVLEHFLRNSTRVGMLNVARNAIEFHAEIAREALALDPPRIHIAIEQMNVLADRLSSTRDELQREILRLRA